MKFKIFTFCFTFTIFLTTLECRNDEVEAHLESKEGESAEKSHRVDSLNLLIFVSLLIMTILTIWLFKRVRLRFVHETGLSIIYGLIVGAIIKYSSSSTKRVFQVVSYDPTPFNVSSYLPPDYLKLNIVSQVENGSSISPPSNFYQYSLMPQTTKEDSTEPELEEKATFDPEVFFNVLLPPIIFNAGYSMKRKHFFKNFGAISVFAFLGTVVSSFVISFIMYGFLCLTNSAWSFNDCLKFGSIISATDPVLAIFNDLNVDVDLYALVFGESILNDAVAIILVSTVDAYKSEKTGFDGLAVITSVGNFFIIFSGAFALGCGMGCVTALMTKYTHIRDHPLLETSLFVLMSYCTFLAAEASGMTGIVAVLFCGICQAHYTYNNMSSESKARTKQIFELLNFLMENFVFVYIGVSTFTFHKHVWDLPFIFMSFLAIIAARTCNIYPLSMLLNLGRRVKIPLSFQHFMMFSGLRGAMAFALAIRDTSSPQECTIFTTTLTIVMTTIVLSGGFTTQLLLWLKIRVGIVENREIQSFESLQSSPQRYMGDDGSSLQEHQRGNNTSIFRLWHIVDNKFIKPLLTHARPPLTETMPKCCLPLSKLLTTEQQKQQVSIAGGERADDDSDFEFAGAGEQELNYEDALLHSNSVFNLNNSHSESGGTAGGNHIVEGQTQVSLQVKLPGATGDPV